MYLNAIITDLVLVSNLTINEDCSFKKNPENFDLDYRIEVIYFLTIKSINPTLTQHYVTIKNG